MAIAHYRDHERICLSEIFQKRFHGCKVMDAGCGTGGNFPLLKKAGCDIVGIDGNDAQVAELVRKGFEAHGKDFLPGPQSCDVILMSHIIEHLQPAELCEFVNRYLTALKPEGRLIILTPVAGERFWHDFTHIRPYYPQSIRMMFNGISTAASMNSVWKMELEDIFFFRDPFKLRQCRAFYPCASCNAVSRFLVSTFNSTCSILYAVSKGRFGKIASWLGIYRMQA